MNGNEIKENKSWSLRAPLSLWWLTLGCILTALALVAVAHINQALPPARPPPPHSPAEHFSGVRAHEHLVNLTSIGPRVAGSYENEVLAVAELVRAVKHIAAGASPHNSLEVDLHRGSGAFPLTFFDGMNNIYRGVQSVVVRVRGKGGGGRGGLAKRRSALLLNCHFDTVPDSPGASDDGAGCAVLLETLRALAATPRPLRHDAIFLLNGAEENIMQASHAFVTTHKWAGDVRAFINLEACGAGGREVLFQAGPNDPWLVETYAASVPRPFASSLAQEIFESGLVPADTDFRIFRDWGGASGVDLAWSARGYVYHTPLDTAARAPPPVLQRTGDNVLAYTHALLSSDKLESEPDLSSRQPVFFDVLGVWLVCVSEPTAALAAAVAVLLVGLSIRADAQAAKRHLYVPQRSWWVAVCACAVSVTLAQLAGVLSSAAIGALQHALGARMLYYSQPALLALIHAVPAVCASWSFLLWRLRSATVGAIPVHGWWVCRLVGGAVALGWALLSVACSAARLRSGFGPLQWALLLAVARPHTLKDGAGLLWWCVCSALPLLQTWYLAHNLLTMFVPLTARSGTAPVPPDVTIGVLTSAVTLAACSWLLPVVALSRHASRLILGGAVLSAAVIVSLLPWSPLSALAPPYAADRPQRYMVFHTRVTTHRPGELTHWDGYWMPHLDSNTPTALHHHVPELASASFDPQDCVQWPYCGAPYYLPVLGLIARGYTTPTSTPTSTPTPPEVNVTLTATTETLNTTLQAVHLHINGPSHLVVILSPMEGGTVTWCDALGGPPLRAAPWGRRHTYFLTLHDAQAEGKGGVASWSLTFHISHSFQSSPAHWATLSVAGHGMGRPRAAPHQALLDRLPQWAVATGWGVHMHLLHV